MPRAWGVSAVAREEVNRRLTGSPRMAPLDYFKGRFCLGPRRLALLLGAADGGLAVELVRSGVAERVIGVDESEERVAAAAEGVPDDLRDVIVFGVEGPDSYPP